MGCVGHSIILAHIVSMAIVQGVSGMEAAGVLGTIYSFQMVDAGTGMALGGWLGGFLFDVSGAYTWSIAAAILTTCLGIPLALALPRHKRPPAAGAKAVVKPVPAAG